MTRLAASLLAGLMLAAGPPPATHGQREALRQRNALWKAGHAAWREGRQADALASLHKVLDIERRVLGPWHRDTEQTADRLGDWRQERGEWAEEAECRRAVIDARRRLDGEGHWRTADARREMAESLTQQKRSPAQRDALRRALALTRKALAMDEDGRPAQALPLAREALALRKDVLGEKHLHYAVALMNLASIHHSLGEHDAAVPLNRRALALIEEALGHRHPLYVTALNNLAFVYKDIGAHKAAGPLFEKALALRRDLLGERHPHHADALNNLALLRREMGDFKAALALFRRALALRGEILGERHPDYATSLGNLALAHHDLGDHDAAFPLYERSLRLRKEVYGERHPQYANALNNLAFLHMEMGDPRAALPLFEKALALRKEAPGEGHPDYATSLANLASAHAAMGDRRAALPLCEKALALRSRRMGGRHPSRAISLAQLAGLYLDMGRPGAALPLQEEALRLTLRYLNDSASVQSERQQLAAADALRGRLNLRLSIPEEAGHFSHSHVLAWKGASFSAQLTRRIFLQSRADPATARIAEELREAARSLARLSSRSGPGVRERLRELTVLKEQKEARLAELSEPFRDLLRPPDSEGFRRSLPPGVLLVDFLAYAGYDPGRPARVQKWQRRLAAWVVRRDAPAARIDLGPIRPIEEDIDAWREAIARGGGGPAPARLRERVWSPLERHLAGAKLILISPDGALGKLPFAALPGRVKGTYLLEEVPLAVLPVPRALPRLLKPAAGKPSLLALGGVDYGDGALAQWQPLPATASEADAVAALFRSHFKGGVSALAAAKATASAVREALPRHHFAHLATHGYFAPASMRSALGRDDKGGSDGDGVTGWSPGLLSGLVLAGANRPASEDGGTLTALEIAEMDLSGVELAVLSACQTGLGQEAGGEGMLGLQRAFAVAGCRSVVSSLWSVDDAATGVLMERFYHHLWGKRLSRLEALRQAQLDVLKSPDLVNERVRRLAGIRGLRSAGKAERLVIAGKAVRRSPVAWWAAWQLSGDWR
jgi:CHAT domain-containing protein/tetratricopeptide (TPR) repeat protein